MLTLFYLGFHTILYNKFEDPDDSINDIIKAQI